MSRLGRGFPNNQLMRQVPILAAPPVFDSAGTGGNLNTASLSITTVKPNTYVIVDVQTDRAATIGTPTIDSVAMTKLASSGWTVRFGLAVAASGSHSISAGTGTAWDASAAVAYTNVARVVSTVTGPTSVTLAAGQLALMALGRRRRSGIDVPRHQARHFPGPGLLLCHRVGNHTVDEPFTRTDLPDHPQQPIESHR